MQYRILRSTDVNVRLPSGTAGIHDQARFMVSLGKRRVLTSCRLDSTLATDTICLPQGVIDGLQLPTELRYQVNLHQDTLRLGPATGLLMTQREIALDASRRSYLRYTANYREMGGVLVLFAADGVGQCGEYVRGYYYDPTTHAWRQATLPLPETIYRRVGLSASCLDRLIHLTNKRLFNSSYFNKWHFAQITQGSHIENYLPKTALLESWSLVGAMVERFAQVYLKPVNGTMAHGLVKVWKEGSIIRAQTPDCKEASSFHAFDKAEQFWLQTKSKGQYLIQQGLNPLRLEGRNLDFRVVMQKDETMRWQPTGILGRAGRIAGISSNFMDHGFAGSFNTLLSRCGLSEPHIRELEQAVVRVAEEVCYFLDSTDEQYCDLGLDILIDDEYRIWVLEVNKRHDHSLLAKLEVREPYLSQKANPTRFLAALCGFNVQKNCKE